MSLCRFVYYSGLLGGWAAFLAWLVAELLYLGGGSLRGTAEVPLSATLARGTAEVVLTAALVGAAVGLGLCLVSGMTNPRRARQLRRLVPGLVGGGIGGAVGGLLGAVVYSWMGWPRALGWIVMGLGIGGAEGVYEASAAKLRNGLIGGGLGGLMGGLLFDPIAGSGSGMSSRATAFLILGLSVGTLIGLTHVVLRSAWLTVVDGFGSGRQLILSSPVTVLGRGDHLPLPFLGYPGRDLEPEHLDVTRQPNGQYVVQDRNSRIGTRVNGELIQAPTALNDGDLIKLGTNLVRFNQRRWGWRRQPGRGGGRASPQAGGMTAPPPPPPGPSSGRGDAPESADAASSPEAQTRRGAAPRIPPPPPPPG